MTKQETMREKDHERTYILLPLTALFLNCLFKSATFSFPQGPTNYVVALTSEASFVSK